MERPEGLQGPLLLRGHGRDVVTDETDQQLVADSARVTALVAYARGRVLENLEVDPGDPRLVQLLGSSVGGGFRRVLMEAMSEGGEARSESVLYQLLDDFPAATLISGQALAAAGQGLPAGEGTLRPDLCAGWRTGGTMLQLADSGAVPAAKGPAAPIPTIVSHSDTHSTSEPELAMHDMRRARRLDVWKHGGQVRVESHLRDTHRGVDGIERVVHEYELRAIIDGGRIAGLEVSPRVLPWPECPAAASKAGALLGMELGVLRDQVRKALTGPASCTHLNDQVRSLAAVPRLEAWIRHDGTSDH